MAISGVCASVTFFKRQKSNTYQVQERLGLSFKTTQELNKIIDDELPGRPPFKCHKVLVDNEVCEVYYRDVIACICALFGDPDFASMLAFRPEKHYVDKKKEEHMYHDMHTGQWWWCMQVSHKGCMCQNVAYFGSTEGC
jgi:Plavaka transposase